MRALGMAAVCVLACCGCWKATEAIKGGKATAEAEKTSPAMLAKHPYWEAKMTAEKIEAIVKLVEKADRSKCFMIDESGEVYVPEDGGQSFRDLFTVFGTERRIIFDMRAYRTRPTREQILADFSRMLNEEEFKPKVKRNRE